MQGNQAPQYVSHLITNCHFSFFTYCRVQSEVLPKLVVSKYVVNHGSIRFYHAWPLDARYAANVTIHRASPTAPLPW